MTSLFIPTAHNATKNHSGLILLISSLLLIFFFFFNRYMILAYLARRIKGQGHKAPLGLPIFC